LASSSLREPKRVQIRAWRFNGWGSYGKVAYLEVAQDADAYARLTSMLGER
jgi:agmatine/peptidylarginine deiminase